MTTNLQYLNDLSLSVHAPEAVQIQTLKRFEFSASRSLDDGRLSGNNFIGWAGVHGPVDEQTGMQINIAELKEIIHIALDRFDHRNLTRQMSPDIPTTANIARALFNAVKPELSAPIQLNTLELYEEDENAAVAGQEETIQIIRTGFSAAHRTHAPRLSVEENRDLYGICSLPHGHGHNYLVEAGMNDPAQFPHWLVAELDHRNLNNDIHYFQGRNVVTEAIARYIADHTPQSHWVRAWETPDFFAEYIPIKGLYRLGRQYRFHAAHRLESPMLSGEENQLLYGKCNRPEPHGHTYRVQVIVESLLDHRTETAFDLGELDRAAAAVLQPLEHTYLDEEIPYFEGVPSTGENIVNFLYSGMQSYLGNVLHQVKLWETPNNQFTSFKHST
jgi:6-pyruvoyltetrahydropterin/6-carboxytetrahydropterin synthase